MPRVYPFLPKRLTHTTPIHVAATLILNCLSLCCACNTSLSTAYPSLSFFPFICFSLSASLLLPSPPETAFSPTFPPIDDDRPKRPSSKSHRAINACSLRSSRAR